MSTSNGAIQNNGQIQWVYSVSGVSQGTTHAYVKATAYFLSVKPYSQYYNGSKSWSGAWGSGSGAQAYNLSAGSRVQVVTTGGNGLSVALTDAQQTRSFTVVTNHFFGTTSSTITVNIPARYAKAPTQLMITRNSDTSHRLNWNRNSTYTAVVVQRRVNGGAWAQVARPTGNASTWTDTSTRAGNKYEYRVAGVGGSGQSGWSNTATVYTSPNAPTGVNAERVGSNIIVNASGKPAYATSYNIRDGSTTVATGVSLPWTHTNPNASQVHQYTVQGVVSGLAGAWSAASNAVQLVSKPLAPSGLSPNGAVSASDANTVLRWKHTPVDSSAQSAGEVRYRVKGVSAWTTRTVTTAQLYSVALAAAEYEWQVRTKGAHPDWSDWSAIATATVVDRPGVAVTNPEAVLARRQVVVEWTYSQDQARPQSAWEVELHGPMGLMDRKTGSGATRKVTMSALASDGEDYEVKVRAATGAIWSAWASQGFTVVVPAAAPAIVSGDWSEQSGQVTIDIEDGRGGYLPDVRNYFMSPRFAGSGVWLEVARNLIARSTLSDSTTGWTVNGTNFTHAVARDGLSLTAKNDVTSVASAISTSTAYIVPFPAGEQYAYTAAIRNDGRKRFTAELSVYFRNAAGGNVDTPPGNRVVLNPGEEVELTLSGVSPEGSVDIRGSISVGGSIGTFPVGGVLTILDGMTLVKGTQVSRGRICGGIESPDTDFRVRWLGAEFASESVLEGERALGVSGSRALALSATYEGKPALRLVPTNTYTQASDTWTMASFSVPEALRAGGVAIGTVHVPEARTGPLALIGIRASSPHQDVPAPYTEPGSFKLRNEYSDLTGSFTIQLWHGGARDSGDVWWTDVGLFEPGYEGPAFSGSTGAIEIDGSWRATQWDGAIDNSTSTARMAPAAEYATVERSVDGGETWSMVSDQETLPATLTDNESLSNGTTLYRVTTVSADEASTTVLYEVEANSPAVWLSGGSNLEDSARLPYDPEVGITAGRERVVRKYAGRERPVVHAGEATNRVVSWGGRIISGDPEVASQEVLERIALASAPLHLYRDPDGRHVKGMLSDLQITREHDGVWSYQMSIEQADG